MQIIVLSTVLLTRQKRNTNADQHKRTNDREQRILEARFIGQGLEPRWNVSKRGGKDHHDHVQDTISWKTCDREAVPNEIDQADEDLQVHQAAVAG